MRHARDEIRIVAVNEIRKAAEKIASDRGLIISCEELLNQAAVSMDERLVLAIERASKQIGEPARRMVSGAGHDAMIIARRIPSAMLFLRSPGGISHHPDESVRVEDVEKAIHAGYLVLSQLAKERSENA